MILYHGTRAGFRGRGGLLLPPAETGAAANHEVSAPRWIYVTTDRDTAVAFARAARGRGRPRLLEVSPLERLEPDPANDVDDAYRCRGAVVLRVEILEDETPRSPAWAGRTRRTGRGVVATVREVPYPPPPLLSVNGTVIPGYGPGGV